MNVNYVYKQPLSETSRVEDFKSGVYGILNSCNNKIYIGSSLNLRKRHNAHKTKLNCNRHTNIHLQKSIIKYGIDKFEFIIFEFCDINSIIKREQYWIDRLNCTDNKSGYNKRVIAESNKGYTFKMPKAAKKKLSDIGKLRGKTEDFRNFMSTLHSGKLVSIETRERMSASHKGYKWSKESLEKRSKSQQVFIINLDTSQVYSGFKECADDLKVSKTTIFNWLSGKHISKYNLKKVKNKSELRKVLQMIGVI